MKSADFTRLLTRYLGQYLPGQRNLSRETIPSYRDTFKLLLRFCQTERGWPAETITIAHLNPVCLEAFLHWLKMTHRCGIATRNQRLAALHAFFRWSPTTIPPNWPQPNVSWPFPEKRLRKRWCLILVRKPLGISLRSHLGIPCRDGAMPCSCLCSMTAVRVQELVDLRVGDVRLATPSVVTLTGKGSKRRTVPLMAPTTPTTPSSLIPDANPSPGGVSPTCCRNMSPWRRAPPTWNSPRTFHPMSYAIPKPFQSRSKAVHMLQSRVNLIYLRDFLGHRDITTTQIYARVGTETRRRALKATRIPGLIRLHQLCRLTALPDQV